MYLLKGSIFSDLKHVRQDHIVRTSYVKCRVVSVRMLRGTPSPEIAENIYEGESNEYIKRTIKILNAALLPCKLTTMILMV